MFADPRLARRVQVPGVEGRPQDARGPPAQGVHRRRQARVGHGLIRENIRTQIRESDANSNHFHTAHDIDIHPAAAFSKPIHS